MVYFFFTLLFTYPSVHKLSDRVIGDGGDNYQFLAFQYLAKQQFDQGQLPFGWTNYWRYPVGFNFANSFDSPIFLTIGIVFYQLSSDPVVVYNLTVLTLLFFNALLSYFFFYEISRSQIAGFAGGLMYGFSFYSLARMGGHPNLILIGCFPFLLYALLIFLKRQGDSKAYILLTTAVALIYLSSLQHLLLLAGALLVYLPLTAVFFRKELLAYFNLVWKTKKKLIWLIAANSAVFLFFYYAKIFSFFDKSLVLPGAEIVSPQWQNFFLPNSYFRLVIAPFLNNTPLWIENAVFLGFMELLLFICFFTVKRGAHGLKPFLFLNALFFLILALGDARNPLLPMPYRFLFPFMPFRGIVESGRFYIFLYLTVVSGSVLYLAKVLPKISFSVLVIILLSVAFERLPVNFYLSSTLKNESFYTAVADSPSSAVLDLPLFPEWWHGNMYDMYSIYYHKPIVNGYIHWSGLTADTKILTDKMHRFECNLDPEFIAVQLTRDDLLFEKEQNRILLQDLLGYNIRTVVYHKDLGIGPKECLESVQRIDAFLHNSNIDFVLLYEDIDKAVYYLNEP